MTKNERKMMLELAKGIARLSQAVNLLRPSIQDDKVAAVLSGLLQENDESIKTFVEMADKEWINHE